MGRISGVVRKGEDPVEGAKVYLLLDDEVVASAETNEDGEYACDGLDDAEKYHVVVEYDEEDNDEVIHYSAKSMPGIEPIPEPERYYLYNEGEGKGIWECYAPAGYPYGSMCEIGDNCMIASIRADSGGGNLLEIRTKDGNNVDVSDYSSLKVEYESKESNHFPDEYSYFDLTVGQVNDELPVNPEGRCIGVLDISSVTGQQKITMEFYSGDNGNVYFYIYKIWLEE